MHGRRAVGSERGYQGYDFVTSCPRFEGGQRGIFSRAPICADVHFAQPPLSLLRAS